MWATTFIKSFKKIYILYINGRLSKIRSVHTCGVKYIHVLASQCKPNCTLPSLKFDKAFSSNEILVLRFSRQTCVTKFTQEIKSFAWLYFELFMNANINHKPLSRHYTNIFVSRWISVICQNRLLRSTVLPEVFRIL